ncbi:glycosyltransferase [Enterobacteriaceae bacterium EKM102V]|uniref:nucleotide disphospho-sugar-binding domain-containing protein n=1 Tax=Pantoea TaxID=53335 RepID=UPI00142DDE82|nr:MULTISPECIES: glycosyltransferase [Pantoea]KAF6662404.1 glycosyltransferase [Enterobacteriaceae bacterium EKM102V]KAF6670870.1 glycosyltransferase [Pantoea sp. EKM103V]
MRILFIGPPLYGLLFPLISLAQAFRTNGHEVVVASAGHFANKTSQAGLTAFDAAPSLNIELQYCEREKYRKKNNKTGNFSFFSDEMADKLVEYTEKWQPDLIIYPPLGVVGAMLAAKFSIPSIVHTVGFAHTPKHFEIVKHSFRDAYIRHNVKKNHHDKAWIDIAPPSMSILYNSGEPILPMRYIPYNGGAVHEKWWERKSNRKRLLVSLGTVKPLVDGLNMISWVITNASEVDAEIILHIPSNARSGLNHLPNNVRLVEWIPTGVFLNGADGFIHHGGAGNTLTALNNAIPQLIFGEGADRPVNAKLVAERGCGLITGARGLSTDLVNAFLNNTSIKKVAKQVSFEMALQPSPSDVAKEIILKLPSFIK